MRCLLGCADGKQRDCCDDKPIFCDDHYIDHHESAHALPPGPNESFGKWLDDNPQNHDDVVNAMRAAWHAGIAHKEAPTPRAMETAQKIMDLLND